MPIVFVHGVNNRPGPDWHRRLALRHELFKGFTLPGLVRKPESVHFEDPMWGEKAAKFYWNHASLPDYDEPFESFGGADSLALEALSPAGSLLTSDRVLLNAAEQSLTVAVDAIWATTSERPSRLDRDWTELGRAATAYALEEPHPAWLQEVTSDQEFIERLREAIMARAVAPPLDAPAGAPAYESFGAQELWDRAREAADRLRAAVVGSSTELLLKLGRERLHRDLGLGVADILVYMDQRGTVRQPGPIVALVLAALERARAAVNDEDPRLVLVGHSMGGIILYDIVSHFAPELPVGALITVGSQVGVLEEAKVFRASERDVPSAAKPKVAMPGQVAHWLNVFDLNDPASFLVAPLFDGAADYRFESGLSPRAAHSAYFVRPSFYQRLHERLAEAWG